MLKIGDSTPDFSTLDQSGKNVSLKDFKGRWLFLYFYPKDFTSGCTTEACQLRDNFDKLQKMVEVVGVSSDSVESHAKFAEKHSLPFTLLADPKRKLIKTYGVGIGPLVKRVSFLINPETKIVKIYNKVDPKTHATQIIADLKKLQK
jgi:peroxiredoxin Q/BCP